MVSDAGAGGNPMRTARGPRVEATEARILAAARELFLQQGYQDTTLAVVAARAGVGARTVYLRFGAKGTVLLRAAEAALTADAALAADATSGPDAAAGSDGGSGPDGTRGSVPGPIAEFARRARIRRTRLGGLLPVLIQASATEPFVAEAVGRARAADRRGAAELIDELERRGSVGSRVDRASAVETVAVLASDEAWLHLTGSAGWSAKDYQDWLATSIHTLVAG